METATSETFDQTVRTLILYANKTPELLSLLYDMDLLPEQVSEGTRDWSRMVLLIAAWKHHVHH